MRKYMIAFSLLAVVAACAICCFFYINPHINNDDIIIKFEQSENTYGDQFMKYYSDTYNLDGMKTVSYSMEITNNSKFKIENMYVKMDKDKMKNHHIIFLPDDSIDENDGETIDVGTTLVNVFVFAVDKNMTDDDLEQIFNDSFYTLKFTARNKSFKFYYGDSKVKKEEIEISFEPQKYIYQDDVLETYSSDFDFKGMKTIAYKLNIVNNSNNNLENVTVNMNTKKLDQNHIYLPDGVDLVDGTLTINKDEKYYKYYIFVVEDQMTEEELYDIVHNNYYSIEYYVKGKKFQISK